jgi:hypothetical protein
MRAPGSIPRNRLYACIGHEVVYELLTGAVILANPHFSVVAAPGNDIGMQCTTELRNFGGSLPWCCGAEEQWLQNFLEHRVERRRSARGGCFAHFISRTCGQGNSAEPDCAIIEGEGASTEGMAYLLRTGTMVARAEAMHEVGGVAMMVEGDSTAERW